MVPLVGLAELLSKFLMISPVGLAYICTKIKRRHVTFKYDTFDMTYARLSFLCGNSCRYPLHIMPR